MRFVVYGAGAIGGVVGGRLAQGGYDVALIARGAHYEAIRDRGLRIQSPDDDATLEIPVANHPSQLDLGADDVVILAMKSQDTIGACESLDACAPPDIAVSCFQNGVENERVVLRHFANTYAVCVMSPTSHIEPGVVIAQSAPVSGLLDIGRYPTGVDDRTQLIADALNASTFHSIPRPDVMRWKYTKLLMNLANSIEASVTPDAWVKELAAIVRAEGEACLRAAGIDFASREEDKERRADRMQVRPVNGEYRGAGRHGRAWRAEPTRSRPTTSTGRSCCSAACTVCPPPRTRSCSASRRSRRASAPRPSRYRSTCSLPSSAPDRQRPRSGARDGGSCFDKLRLIKSWTRPAPGACHRQAKQPDTVRIRNAPSRAMAAVSRRSSSSSTAPSCPSLSATNMLMLRAVVERGRDLREHELARERVRLHRRECGLELARAALGREIDVATAPGGV